MKVPFKFNGVPPTNLIRSTSAPRRLAPLWSRTRVSSPLPVGNDTAAGSKLSSPKRQVQTASGAAQASTATTTPSKIPPIVVPHCVDWCMLRNVLPSGAIEAKSQSSLYSPFPTIGARLSSLPERSHLTEPDVSHLLSSGRA